MNYAATLAVMVVLAFCFPLTLRLGAGFSWCKTGYKKYFFGAQNPDKSVLFI